MRRKPDMNSRGCDNDSERERLSFPARLFIRLIKSYQLFVSPRSGPCCRYTPSCSQYAIDALKIHGAFKGFFLAVWRIMRCNPFSKGGYDPVPNITSEKQLNLMRFFVVGRRQRTKRNQAARPKKRGDLCAERTVSEKTCRRLTDRKDKITEND